jgi:hypothetical protein
LAKIRQLGEISSGSVEITYMPIPYSGGPNGRFTFAGSNPATVLNAVREHLLWAQWADVRPLYASMQSNFANNEGKIRIGSQEYTVKAPPINNLVPGEIVWNADGPTTLSNIVNAVNGGVGRGSVYSVTTPQNPYFSAEAVGSDVIWTARTGGPGGNGLTVWPYGTFRGDWRTYGGGWVLQATTPQGRSARLRMWHERDESGLGVLLFQFTSTDETKLGYQHPLWTHPAITELAIIAGPCHCFISRPGDVTSQGTAFAGGVPYISDKTSGICATHQPDDVSDIWWSCGNGWYSNAGRSLATSFRSALYCDQAQSAQYKDILTGPGSTGGVKLLEPMPAAQENFVYSGGYRQTWADGTGRRVPAFVSWGLARDERARVRACMYDGYINSAPDLPPEFAESLDDLTFVGYTGGHKYGSLMLLTQTPPLSGGGLPNYAY